MFLKGNYKNKKKMIKNNFEDLSELGDANKIIYQEFNNVEILHLRLVCKKWKKASEEVNSFFLFQNHFLNKEIFI